MAENDPLTVLTDRLAVIAAVYVEQQAAIQAILHYLRAQPSFDVAQMARILEEERGKLGLARGDSETLVAALQDFLRAYKGPSQ